MCIKPLRVILLEVIEREGESKMFIKTVGKKKLWAAGVPVPVGGVLWLASSPERSGPPGFRAGSAAMHTPTAKG